MVDKLRQHPNKISAPTRDYIIEIFNHGWEDTLQNIDGELMFK